MNLTLSKVFDIEPKSNYKPQFTENNNAFQDAYSKLHQLIGSDFHATDYRYNEKEHKVYFNYNGVEQSVNPGDKNMLLFIIENVKASKSGRQFFPVRIFSVTEEHYYYLSTQQKQDLGILVKLNF